jgi:hypothetical protein
VIHVKRKSILSLSAALPVAALTVGALLAHPPSATATTLPSSPAKSVAASASAVSDYIIIIITSAEAAQTGIKSADSAAAAKSLDV